MVIVAMVGIQSGASFAKELFPLVGPQGATMLRLLFAAVILVGIWRPWRTKLTRREVGSILVYGISLGGLNLLFYLALVRIPLGIAVALEFTGPLAVALIASRRPRDFLWVALAIAGIAVLLPITGTSESLDPIGVVFALGAGFCWFLYIVFGRRSGSTVHGGTATALGMAVAALTVLPFGLACSTGPLFVWSVLPIALGVAILSSIIPYSLEMVALKRLPAGTFGILMSLEPAIAALSGLLFLGEQLALLHYLGMGFIVIASIGSTLDSTERSCTTTPSS